MHESYNPEFYDEQKDYSLTSAKVIVPLILEVFPVTSVVDIGCGAGTWMSIFLEKGITDIIGFDVSDLPDEYYFVEKELIEVGFDFCSSNLELNVSAELAVCLEVAEHLPESVSDNLVNNLVNTAPVVIFSAAFPGQTGVNHINEQPPWYWRKKFSFFGYTEIDFLRPLIWCNSEVAWWYRQNITSYISFDALKSNQKAIELYNRFKDPNSQHRLTLISESILKNLFSETHKKKWSFTRLKNLLKMSF